MKLRQELDSLRAELRRVTGEAVRDEAAEKAEREKLERELASEHEKLRAIQGAVDKGLDPATVEDTIAKTQARIEELEARLAKPSEPRPTSHSLAELASQIEQIEQRLARVEARANTPEAPVADPAPPEPPPTTEEDKLELLPLEFAAFGDLQYSFVRDDADNFEIGSVELDAALELTPWVHVSTALAHRDDEAFELAAFVVDCGLIGDGDHFVAPSSVIEQSGISFGRFDVPFGIAYLEYASIDNRLITIPEAVLATHDGWNDLGVQVYAVAKHWTALAYLVNGPDIPTDDEPIAAENAVGGRVSGKFEPYIELGASLAGDFTTGPDRAVFAGADLTTVLGPLDLRGEYLLEHVELTGVPDDTHGAYGRALIDVDPVFLAGRFDSVFSGREVAERRFSAGGGVEVFPGGEVRAIYEHSLDHEDRRVILQLVGGSTFQPTGLRR